MMIKEKNLTNAEKKRMESLDKRIEKIQNKIAVNRKEYDAMTEELQKLLEERYLERRPEKIKTTLYEAYSHSDRSLDDILAFIEGRDDDIDRNTPGKNKNPRSIFTCFYLKAPSKIISANLTFRSLTAPDNSNIPLVLSVTIKVKVF